MAAAILLVLVAVGCWLIVRASILWGGFQALLQEGRLTALDRATVAETIAQIRIYEAGRIEIDYLFAESEWESADGG